MTSRLLGATAISLCCGVLLIHAAPPFVPVPSRDSGVFLYGGTEILRGRIPYRDFWDHKPPVIFYINAVGLLLAHGSRWGVWAMEWLSLSAAALAAFALLEKSWGLRVALIALAVALANLPLVLQYGNFTEEYALPLTFGAAWLFLGSNPEESASRWVLLGASGALAFLLRQNLVGLWAAIALFLLVFKSARIWTKARVLTLMCGGALVILLPVLAYLAANNALYDFGDSAFRYNFFHVAIAESQRPGVTLTLAALRVTWPFLAGSLLAYGLVVGWVGLDGRLAGFFSRLGLRPELRERLLPLLQLLLVWLPIELIFVNISGKYFLHYYISLVPVMTFLFALLVDALLSLPSPLARVLAAAGWLLLFLVSTIRATEFVWRPRLNDDAQRSAVTEYVKERTKPNDYVLIWGAESVVNFLSGRPSPTRFVYQYPLVMPGYTTGQQLEEFVKDLQTKRPSLIIDSLNKRLPPLLAEPFEAQVSSAKTRSLDFVAQYVRTNYEFVGTIGPQHWPVFSAAPRPAH